MYDDIDKEMESKTWDFREVEDAEEQREKLRRLRKENEEKQISGQDTDRKSVV